MSGARDKLGAAPGGGHGEPGGGSAELGDALEAVGVREDVTPGGSSSWVHVPSHGASVPPTVGEQSALGSVVVTSGSVGALSSTPQASETKSASPPSGPGALDRTPSVGVHAEREPQETGEVGGGDHSGSSLAMLAPESEVPNAADPAGNPELGAGSAGGGPERYEMASQSSAKRSRSPSGAVSRPPRLQLPIASGSLAHAYTLIAAVGARVNVGASGCPFRVQLMKTMGRGCIS